MVFMVVSWFLVGFYCFLRWFQGFSWFLVGIHGFWLVSMVFHDSRLVCHGSRLVFLQTVSWPDDPV